VVGRVKTYEAIIKGENITDPGIPESFKVLLKELQSLALDVKVLDENGNEIKMAENIDLSDEDIREKKSLIEGEDFEYDKESQLVGHGFSEVTENEPVDEALDFSGLKF
jgi:DNA-directed RNA polymerase subunit beta